jgi:hypothetical protein
MSHLGPARCAGAGRCGAGRPLVTGSHPSVAALARGTPARHLHRRTCSNSCEGIGRMQRPLALPKGHRETAMSNRDGGGGSRRTVLHAAHDPCRPRLHRRRWHVVHLHPDARLGRRRPYLVCRGAAHPTGRHCRARDGRYLPTWAPLPESIGTGGTRLSCQSSWWIERRGVDRPYPRICSTYAVPFRGFSEGKPHGSLVLGARRGRFELRHAEIGHGRSLEALRRRSRLPVKTKFVSVMVLIM